MKPVAPCPDAVVELENSRLKRIWKREENVFVPLDSPIARKVAQAEMGKTRFQQLTCGMHTVLVSVKYIAGVQPGVYEDRHEKILVPEFVALTPLPAAAPPPPAFRKLWTQLHDLMGQKNYDKELASDIRKRLEQLYMDIRELKKSSARFPKSNMRRADWNYQFPSDDHTLLFRSSNRVFSASPQLIWTSQPYHTDDAEILGFAFEHGLTVTSSPEWSWHYPGLTTLLEWSKH